MKKIVLYTLAAFCPLLLFVETRASLRLAPDWALHPGDRDYLTTGDTERGMAHDPITDRLYVVSRADGIRVAILDAQTGDHAGFLNVSGIEDSGGTFDLNLIGVADDGAIYAGNLTTNAGNDAFRLWRWADEYAFPVQVYMGDPGYEPNARWGDNIAVRGEGESTTQVLILSHGAASHRSMASILRPSGWIEFFQEIWIDQQIDAMGLGSAFDAGDFYWATRPGKPVFVVGFDLTSGTGTLLRSFGTDSEGATVDAALMGISPIAVHRELGLLAGVREETAEVYLYDIAALLEGEANAPLHVRALPTANSSPGSGSGGMAFHGDRLYVMHANNGIVAYDLTETSDLERWRMEHFGTMENEGDAANDANPAGDGLSNLLKFALGLDPHVAVRDEGPAGGTGDFATPLWLIPPGDRDYLPTSGNNERGMAYSPASGNVYIVSRSAGLQVAILDGETGAHGGFLNVQGIGGGTFDLNTIGVADDGAIYAGNLTTNAGSTPYRLYRWADENAAPVEVYAGEPGSVAGGRWGDNIAVRGAGESTQILILSHATGSDSQQTILQPADAAMNVFTPASLTPPLASMGIGITFGHGDRFWATRRTIPVNEVSFDLQSGNAALLRSFGTHDGESVDPVLLDMSLISIHPEHGLLAGFAFATASLYLYDIAAMVEDGQSVPIESFTMPTSNPSAASGLGGVSLAGNRLYAMPANNGIVAFGIAETDDGGFGLATNRFNTLTFSRPAPVPSGIVYLVETSEDLREWSASAVELVSETLSEGDGRATRVYRDTVPVDANERRFIRLRIVEN